MDEEDQNNKADDDEDQKYNIRPMMMTICDCVYNSLVQSNSQTGDCDNCSVDKLRGGN